MALFDLAGPAAHRRNRRTAASLRRAWRAGRVLSRRANPGGEELFGMRWQSWVAGNDHVPVETWRSDEDLLARTLSGAALPVGQLEIARYCGLSGEVTPLATFAAVPPLLARVPTRARRRLLLGDDAFAGAIRRWPRAASYCTRSCSGRWRPAPTCSRKARQFNAGESDGENPATWTRVADTRSGAFDRSRVSSRRLPRWRSAAGRQPAGG